MYWERKNTLPDHFCPLSFLSLVFYVCAFGALCVVHTFEAKRQKYNVKSVALIKYLLHIVFTVIALCICCLWLCTVITLLNNWLWLESGKDALLTHISAFEHCVCYLKRAHPWDTVESKLNTDRFSFKRILWRLFIVYWNDFEDSFFDCHMNTSMLQPDKLHF